MNYINNNFRNLSFEKGNIIKGRRIIHPVVFLSPVDQDSFEGAMLTHSTQKEYSDNISLLEEHFETHDSSNNEYSVKFNNSYFVGQTLLKRSDFGPFRKVGKLTETDIEFIEENRREVPAILWVNYKS
ncbi:MAG: hypothetical protein KJ571_07110 [Bacteroidetes bacterium]|nr:hypothetical protein [Bacteroidota bacterium]